MTWFHRPNLPIWQPATIQYERGEETADIEFDRGKAAGFARRGCVGAAAAFAAGAVALGGSVVTDGGAWGDVGNEGR